MPSPPVRARPVSHGQGPSAMNKIAIWLASLPLLGRWTLVGTVGLGAAGAAVGLVIGLFV